jgi:hypothetical protein
VQGWRDALGDVGAHHRPHRIRRDALQYALLQREGHPERGLAGPGPAADQDELRRFLLPQGRAGFEVKALLYRCVQGRVTPSSRGGTRWRGGLADGDRPRRRWTERVCRRRHET